MAALCAGKYLTVEWVKELAVLFHQHAVLEDLAVRWLREVARNGPPRS